MGPVAERHVSRRTEGGVGVKVPEPMVYPPSPFEEVFNIAIEGIHDIFEKGLPTKLWFYELPLDSIPRRDLLRGSIDRLASEWGEVDKLYNGQTGYLFRDGIDHGELIARVNVPDTKILIPLRDGEESAVGKVRTVIGTLTSNFVAAEIAEDMQNYFTAEHARQARVRDHQGALKSREPGFHPRAIRTF